MTLHEQILDDNERIFFELDDFAVPRVINGKSIKVVEDGDKLLAYKQLGIYEGSLLFFARKDDLPGPFRPGDALIYGNVKWYIEDCREDLGVLEIILKRNAGGGIGR